MISEKVKIGLIGLALVLGIYNTVKISTATSAVNTRIDDLLLVKPATNTAAVAPLNDPSQIQNNPIPQSNLEAPKGPSTSIKFNKEIHDFGKVDANTDNPYSFVFTNTGKEPLLITDAKGSCGCTVPSWPKEAILPGQTGKIDVVFRPSTGQAGQPQEKTVTVTANTEPVNTVVRIKAMVNPAAE